MSRYGRGWGPYVPVAKRRAQARKKMAALQKKGAKIQPIEIEGRKIAHSFWGEGWCDHLESFSDYENRVPRGRTYVRNGSVCHLAIDKGNVEAKVAGSEIYEVRVKIETLSKTKWNDIKKVCSGHIGSLLELLQGRLSENIMAVVTDRKTGLFPKPAEIKFTCDCPDYADMCKHVAAVLYGVGARLDVDPSLLFRLRGVNHEELIDAQIAVPVGTGKGKSKRLAADSLGDVFGIDLDATTDVSSPKKKQAARKKTAAKSGVTKRKARKKKSTLESRGTKKNAKKSTTKKVRKATEKLAKSTAAPRKTTKKKKVASKKTSERAVRKKASRAPATNSMRSTKKSRSRAGEAS